ncbi:MAG: hypothetical protein D6729_19535 [Deltaproteobacteria bacterium]|nr:MAG: hypothetical protein D6729_19535 [Deltaproteobacteria bacterium]
MPARRNPARPAPQAVWPRLWLLARTRTAAVVAALWVLVMGVAAFLPLVDTPGYPHALLLNLLVGLLGPVAGMAAAHLERRIAEVDPDPALPLHLRRPEGTLSAAALPTATAGLLLLLLLTAGLATALLSGALKGTCDLAAGLAWYPVLPLPSVLPAVVAGVWMGAATRRRWPKVLLYLLLAVVSSLPLAYLLLTGPQSFAYHHLYGFVAGPLYDERIEIGSALLAYRGLTILVGLLGLSLLALLLHPRRFALARPRLRRRPLVLSLALLAAVTAIEGAGGRIGFRQTYADLERALGGRVETDHFIIHYPRERGTGWVRRTVADHEFRYAQLVAWLRLPPEVLPPKAPKIHSWIFRNREEKGRLTGARHTSIAKPWQRAFFLHDEGHPHRTLKHELAHVLAASLAPGPFHVASSNGIVPNDGLIEGLAVAADWRADRASPHGWARAMMALGVAPPIESLFHGSGLRFAAASRAYTLAGSFVRWLADTRGIGAVKAAYQAGRLDVLGDPKTLFDGWRRFIAEWPLDPATERAARARFRRPSIFRRRCAIDVARWKARAIAAQRGGRAAEAAKAWRRCADLEPDDPAHLKDLAFALWDAGEAAAAEAVARQALTHAKLDPGLEARLRMRLGDEAWKRGDEATALTEYARVQALDVDPNLTRLAAAKQLAARDPALAGVLRPFLLGQIGGAVAAVHLMERLAEHPDSALLHYLVGRQLFNGRDYVGAHRYLAAATRLGLPADGGLAVENLRLAALALLESGRYAEAAQAFDALAVHPLAGEGLQVSAHDFAERARFLEAHPSLREAPGEAEVHRD